MPDLKPERFAAGERETLLGMLRYQRESVVRKVAGLDDAAARRALVPSGTNLHWLVDHLTHAEATWIVGRFVGEDVTVVEHDTLADAVDAYRAMWTRVDEVVAAARLDDLVARMEAPGPLVNLRWVLTHLVQETARHAGHADIIRELVDGQTGR